MHSIPYARQSISAEDIRAVLDVLQSDFLTQGPAVERFEKIVTDYCGAKHGISFANATAALHVACLALGLREGDELWTSPNSFVASANCGLYCGAKVDFVDIDPRTYNMSVAALEEKLKHAKAQGRLPKIVIPVHFSGQSCEMAAIGALAKKYGFKIIEDASHAVGGSYQGAKVGACRHADAVVFSFHPVKIITTGEGGMIMTNNDALATTVATLRSHGITRDPARMTHASDGPWYYQQIALGFNYRLTDLQAALGASQMVRIDQFVRKRHEIARRYDEALADLPITLPWRDPEGVSALHLYVIRLHLRQIQKTHRQVYEELLAAGIRVNLHYIPIHRQPYYEGLGFRAGQFPEAEHYYGEAISLPMYFELTEADQQRVSSTLGRILRP